jgi:hypothetical protein
LNDGELRRFVAFYGASWPLHRMKPDTVQASRIWIGEFTLEQATQALKSIAEDEGGMQFPPTLSQLRARVLELAASPPPYHALVAPKEDWPPPLGPEPVMPIPDDLRFLYPKKTEPVDADREASQNSP